MWEKVDVSRNLSDEQSERFVEEEEHIPGFLFQNINIWLSY